MQVHFGLDLLPQFKNAIITIGTFDGIHFGHRSILETLNLEAKKNNGESIVITFEPHPRLITDANASQNLKLINTLEEKINILSQLNINHLVVVNFTLDFANQTAEEYIERFLVKHFKPHTIIIGYDHHFGKNRSGNISLLEQLKHKYNYQLIEISSALINDIAVSSTQIRKLLASGEVFETKKLLLNYYTLSGIVVNGKKLGRTLGFPTANIEVDNKYKLIPKNGIYAVKVFVENETHFGVMNIGTNPTTDNDNAIKLEVYILNFYKDIYHKKITIEFIKYIREEKKFESLDELKYWIEKDIDLAREVFDSL